MTPVPNIDAYSPTPDPLHTQSQPVHQDISDAYDRQVYTSNAFWYASPGHVRTAAYLYGLQAPALHNARVLELGCAGGGNLLPFALSYPAAQAVGVDLSTVQVAQGQRMMEALGVSNLRLQAMSLTDIAPEFGQFDYIIAHGVFSWVPPEVREAIMRILRDNLAPEGIGYVSYNTYPGWKAGDIVRDAMLLHSHGIAREEDRLPAAKAMLNLLSEGIAAANPLAPSLRAAVDQLRKQSDYYLTHEYLEIFNNPCYLLEFVDMANRSGLTHVGDAEAQGELSETYGPNVQLNHSVVALGQPREMRQQYLDFAVGRNFRKSLLVHQARASQILTQADLGRLADLRWAGFFAKAEAPAQAPAGVQFFKNHRGQSLHSGEPIVLALIQVLSQHWPASLDVAQITSALGAQLPQQADEANKAILGALQTLFKLNMLRCSLEPSPYDDPGGHDAGVSSAYDESQGDAKRPFAGEARLPALVPGFQAIFEARRDPGFGVGTFNLWHETVNLSLKEAEAYLLPLIDGRHTRQQLTTILRDALTQGAVPDLDGSSLKGRRNLDQKAATIVKNLLMLLGRQALLH